MTELGTSIAYSPEGENSYASKGGPKSSAKINGYYYIFIIFNLLFFYGIFIHDLII